MTMLALGWGWEDTIPHIMCQGLVDSTCLHLAIQGSRTIEDQALDLEKLIRFIPSNHGEAKSSTAFPQLRVDEFAFQLGRVSCKKGFAWMKTGKAQECQQE